MTSRDLDVGDLLLHARPLVRGKRLRRRKKTAFITREEVGTVLFEPTSSFTDLFELSRLHLSRIALGPRPMGGRNEVDLGQFKTTLVFEHDACNRPVPLTAYDDVALICPEPYLEMLPAPV